MEITLIKKIITKDIEALVSDNKNNEVFYRIKCIKNLWKCSCKEYIQTKTICKHIIAVKEKIFKEDF
jgi:hypothetical protein